MNDKSNYYTSSGSLAQPCQYRTNRKRPRLGDTYVLRSNTPRHDRLGDMDPAATMQLGLAGDCPVAVETLETFVDVFADEAASLALKCNATEST